MYINRQLVNFLMNSVYTTKAKHVVTLTPSTHRRHGQDKTLVLLVSAVWTEMETSQDCWRQKILKLNIFGFVPFPNAVLDKTVQSQIHWGLLKTVLTCCHFSSHRQHVQDDNVVLSAVWTRHKNDKLDLPCY